MTAQATQPVSVDNLAAALGEAGVGSDTVLATSYSSTGHAFYAPPSVYDQLVIHYKSIVYDVFRTLAVDNSTQAIADGGSTLDLSVSEDGSTLSSRNGQFKFVALVVAVRSGGGRLLAELLSALGGGR